MSEPDKVLGSIKVVFTGLDGVGTKTSLIKRMALGVFDDTPHAELDSYSTKKVLEVDDGVVTVDLWGLRPCTHTHM